MVLGVVFVLEDFGVTKVVGGIGGVGSGDKVPVPFPVGDGVDFGTLLK